MPYTEPTIYRPRIRWIRVAALLGVIAAIAAVLGHQLLASSSSTASSSSAAAIPIEVLRSGPLGEADGVVPAGTTVFDDRVPGVAKLDPALLAALRQAATVAAASGVQFLVDSGWRSRDYQEQLLRQAISKYGSEVAAARWVAPPDKSVHVKGEAVDLGSSAAAWLHGNGAAYGLCQIYANEPWHFELRPEARVQGCPAMYPDPTHDPRIQR